MSVSQCYLGAQASYKDIAILHVLHFWLGIMMPRSDRHISQSIDIILGGRFSTHLLYGPGQRKLLFTIHAAFCNIQCAHICWSKIC